MKFLLLIGGLSGFGIGLVCSWIKECSWPTMLWHASLGAYAGGLLMRWWGRAWRSTLAQAIHERQSQVQPFRLPSAAKGTKP
jgi:hypothetical protein